MKVLFALLSALAFLVPVALWYAAESFACGYSGNAASCTITVSDYMDDEFARIAVVPWALSALFGFLAWRWGRGRPKV